MIVEKAKEYLGVRFAHQGRSKKGLDCVGLYICVLRDLGIEFEDVAAYGRKPSAKLLLETIRKVCNEVSLDNLQAGDLLLMKYGSQEPLHTAIYAGLKNGTERIILATASGVQMKYKSDFENGQLVKAFRLKC